MGEREDRPVSAAVKRVTDKARGRGEDGWGSRHHSAMQRWHHSPMPSHERAVVNLIYAWADYADDSWQHHGWKIGNDSALGPPWIAIARAISDLLNGEMGRLDCGTVQDTLLAGLAAAGVEDPESALYE